MEKTQTDHRMQAMVPPDLVRRARIVAANQNTNLSTVVRKALEQYVDREEAAQK